MKHLSYLLIAALFLPQFAGANQFDCELGYEELVAGKVFNVRQRYNVRKTRDLNMAEEARDWLRDQAMKLQKRTYPVLDSKDATPVKAPLLAKYTFGHKNAFDGAPFDADKLKKEIEEMLAAVAKYPQQREDFLQDTAAKIARLEAMERAMASFQANAKDGIEIMVPAVKIDAEGNVIETVMKPASWSNRAKFDQDIAELRKELRHRVGDPYELPGFRAKQSFTLDKLDGDRPVVFDPIEYLRNVKKLETYMDEYQDALRAAGFQENVVADAELDPLFKRIEDLFEPGTNKLKDPYRAPYWAWQRIRRQQMAAELKTLITGIRPRLENNESTKAFMDFVNGLSPEDLKFFKLEGVAKTVKIGQKNVYVRTLWALGSTLSTGTIGAGTLKVFWDKIRDAALAKQTCADMDDAESRQFRECVRDYLKSKFSLPVIESLFTGEDPFIDNLGQIKDRDVREEVTDIFRIRAENFQKKRREAEIDKATDLGVGKVGAEIDPTSPAFRESLIMHNRPEQFLVGALGDSADKTKTYFGVHHPLQFKRNEALVAEIFDSAEEARAPLYEQLRKRGAGDLADDVSKMLTDRDRYLADPKAYEDALNKRRKNYQVRDQARKPNPKKTTATDDDYDAKPTPDSKPAKDKE